MESLEVFIQNEDYQAAVLLLEQQILHGNSLDNLDFACLGQHIHSSPLLLKKYSEQLIYIGELRKAKEYLSLALKGFATQTFEDQLLSTFGQLAIVNLKIGEPYEAEVIVRFLYGEYCRQKEMLDGHVFLALAVGSQLISLDIQTKQLFEQAVARFDQDGEYPQSTMALLEMMICLGQWMDTEEWAESCAFMQQRVQLKKAQPVDEYFLSGLREWRGENWQKAQYYFSHLQDGIVNYKYRFLAKMYHAYSTYAQGQTPESWAKLVQDLERLAEEDLELVFALQQTKFTYALGQQQHATCSEALNQAQAIQRSTLLRSQLETLEEMKAQLSSCQRQQNFYQLGESLTHTTPLRIKCFGGLRFERANEEIAHLHWKRKKSQELFLYLLLQPHYAATREQVAEALFEGMEPKKMANQLYVVTHQLKQVFSQQVALQAQITTKDGVIRLPSQLFEYVDIEQYLTLVQVANRLWTQERQLAIELYEKAYQLYEPFVPELQYLDWLDRFRDQLEEKQVSILKKLGLFAWECSWYEQAETYFREWIQIRPLEEEAYQHLLRLLIYKEQPAEAISVYKMMEKVFKAELDSVPSVDSQQIVFGSIGVNG